MNNLLWTLEPLKKQFGGEFFITEGVHYELVGKPLQTKMFKLHALHVQREIQRGVLKVLPSSRFKPLARSILETANSGFSSHEHNVHILQWGETETLAAAKIYGANGIVVDERTTLLLLEDPHLVQKLLERKTHTSIDVNEESIHKLIGILKGIEALRSIELVMIGYELGMFSDLLMNAKDANQILLDALFWGIKLEGCALSKLEIARMLKHELRRK